MGEYIEVEINSPTFGIFKIMFDNEYEDIIKQYHWNITAIRSPRCDYVMYYAQSCKNKQQPKQFLMHRLIMNNPKGFVVDHIDGDTMNNIKSNLRICTSTENKRNCKLYKNSSSGHKGVHWYPYHGLNKWQVTISIDHKQHTIGFCDTYEDAVKLREEAEQKYYGEYAR